ncbi:MAG: hypothetical protein V4525_12595 [Pseudomonadota bacterium]
MAIKFLSLSARNWVYGAVMLATMGAATLAMADSAEQKETKKQSCFVKLGNEREYFVTKHYPNILRKNSSAVINKVNQGIHDWEIYAQGQCISGRNIDMSVWKFIQSHCPEARN